MSDPSVIGVDWGTTNRRAWLMDRDGAIVDARRDAHGIRNPGCGGFAGDLEDLTRDWPDVPRILAGMVGSRGGWQEAPYLPCPAGAADIAGSLSPVEGYADTYIVPGVSLDGEWADVMRGEETQVLGLVDAMAGPALIVIPGTHSKWIRLADDRIERFRTFPTGELYAAVLDHTVIGAVAGCREISEGGFSRGLDAAARGTGFLATLFYARAAVLRGAMPADDCAGYVSGLLIGTELGEAMSLFEAKAECILIGDGELATRYRAALSRASIDVRHEDENTAARGLWRLAGAAGLVH